MNKYSTHSTAGTRRIHSLKASSHGWHGLHRSLEHVAIMELLEKASEGKQKASEGKQKASEGKQKAADTNTTNRNRWWQEVLPDGEGGGVPCEEVTTIIWL